MVYFAPEGSGGLSSRLTAAARARGIEPLPFAYRADCPALTAPDAVAQFTAMIKEAGKQLREQFNVDPVVIFIDTVVAAAGYSKPGDENDAALGQRLMGTLAGLSQTTGALALGVDHFGKAIETGTRGTSAKESHADVVLAAIGDRELTGAIANTRLALRKLREGEAGLVLPFIHKPYEIGTDEDGDPITRVVVEWGADAAATPRPAKSSRTPGGRSPCARCARRS